IARQGGIDLDTPYEQLDPAQQRVILYGAGDVWMALQGDRDQGSGMGKDEGGRMKDEKGSAKSHSSSFIFHPSSFQYKGLMPAIDEAARVSFVYRQKLDHVVSEVPCATCGGSRLRDDAAAARFQDRTIGQLCQLPLQE